MRKTTIILLIVLFIVVAFACWYFWFMQRPTSLSQTPAVSQPVGVEYRNMTYGFKVALPDDWAGYSVSVDKWTGNAVSDQVGEVAFTDGSVISIHNPKWTAANPYQDIPIMVFTLDQWDLLRQDKFHIGAAPIGPSELGRNAKYVFALPARYSYAFPPGYEEVDKIIQSKPLTAF